MKGKSCLVYCLILLFAKEFRLLIEYTITDGIGLLAYICIWPNFFRDLFSAERGVEAIGNLTNSTGKYAIHLANYIQLIDNNLTGCAGLLLLAICLIILLVKHIRSHSIKYKLNSNGTFELSYSVHPAEPSRSSSQTKILGTEWLTFLLVAFSALGYVCMIAKIAPVLLFETLKDIRYIFNVFPCIVIMIVFLLDRVFLRNFEARLWSIVTWSLLFFLVMLGYLSNGVDYLYKGADVQLEALEEYADDRAIFVSELPYFASNLNVYFTKPKAVYQTNYSGLSSLKAAFKNYDEKELLLFVSTDTESIFQLLPELYHELDATGCRFLFETVGRHTAQVYILTL